MDFASLAPLEGGWSGETFVAGAAGEQVVVRIHARNPARAEVDASLLRLVRGLVPVADVLEVRPPTEETPALLVTSFVTGVRGDLLLPTLDDDGLTTTGIAVGRLLAVLGGMPFLTAGDFRGAALTVEPWHLPDGLAGWVESHRADLTHWSHDELAGLAEVADAAQDRLDTVGRVCLVHSDLNPKNLLVAPDSLRITALLDWEHAHAGHPFTDLGNVLRFDRMPAYAEAVLAAYGGPAEALDLARAADLWALVDLASRRDVNPVAARAHDLLLAIARARDVHATPQE